MVTTYTLQPGRAIARGGATVARLQPERDARGRSPITPTEADDLARQIVGALNAGAPLIYQQWRSFNDPSGNPQRLTMIYNGATGEVVAALDHGYAGDRIPRGAVELPSVEISRAAYHATLKQWRDRTAAYEAAGLAVGGR